LKGHVDVNALDPCTRVRRTPNGPATSTSNPRSWVTGRHVLPHESSKTAFIVRRGLEVWGCPRTADHGSKGIHVYVPFNVGPVQNESGRSRRASPSPLAARLRKLVTAEYRIAEAARGPRARRLTTRTPGAGRSPRSTPVPSPAQRPSPRPGCSEKELGARDPGSEGFPLTVHQRVAKPAISRKPLLAQRGRVRLDRVPELPPPGGVPNPPHGTLSVAPIPRGPECHGGTSRRQVGTDSACLAFRDGTRWRSSSKGASRSSAIPGRWSRCSLQVKARRFVLDGELG